MKYNPSFSHHILNKSSKDRYHSKYILFHFKCLNKVYHPTLTINLKIIIFLRINADIKKD